MKKDEVPQDASPIYDGLTKLVYAVDVDGSYVGVPTSGWDVEAYATLSAVEAFEREAREALERARAGLTSPLEPHMWARRMDPDTLAAATGFSRGRIRKHLDPKVFAKLSDRDLAPYVRALGVDAATLRRLPE